MKGVIFLDNLINQFESLLSYYNDYLDEKGLNNSSKEQYILRISKFLEYMDNEFVNPPSKLEYVNEEHVLNFLEYKKQMGSSIANCDNYLRSIKAFYVFLYERGTLKNFILYGIESELERTKISRSYDYFSQAEIFKIINHAKVKYNKEPNYTNSRNYLIILLIVYAALSLQEIYSLDDGDIEIKTRNLYIRTEKSRTIHISEFLANAIEEYRELRAKYGNDKSLFVSKYNTRLSRKAIQGAVKNVIMDSGIIPNGRSLSPSTLRHTAIKTMVENNVELPIICNICGLDLSSLTKYFKLSANLQSLKEQLYLEGHPLIDNEL